MPRNHSYSVTAIANHFIECAGEKGQRLTPLQIQKLAYFAHGHYLAIAKDGEAPLIDEYMEAWRYGPVFNSLYHQLKSYGKRPVTDRIERVNPKTLKVETPGVERDDHFILELLDKIYDLYGSLDAAELLHITHARKGPWKKTVDKAEKEGYRPENLQIPNDAIKEYFRSKAA